MIPSLKDKPPYFDPRLTEAQWLPDVDSGPLDSIVSNPTDEGGTAAGFPSAVSDSDSVEHALINSPVAVSDTLSVIAPTSPVSPSTPLNAINVPVTHTATEKPSIAADTEESSSASAALKYQELESQNTQLLRRIADLTAIVEKHGLSSSESINPAITNEMALSPASPGASTPLFSIETKSPLSGGSAARSSLAHVSPDKEASLPARFISSAPFSPTVASVGVERSDRVAADTLSVMSRLRAIQGFLDSASIRTLLDTISITPSPENDPDTAWSALGMSLLPSRSSGSGSSGGGDRSDAVTGAGSEVGAIENGPYVESSTRECRSDPVETLSLLERVTRALLGRIESQKALLERPQMTISYREFHVGSLALFMPLSPKMDVYLAFNRFDVIFIVI